MAELINGYLLLLLNDYFCSWKAYRTQMQNKKCNMLLFLIWNIEVWTLVVWYNMVLYCLDWNSFCIIHLNIQISLFIDVQNAVISKLKTESVVNVPHLTNIPQKHEFLCMYTQLIYRLEWKGLTLDNWLMIKAAATSWKSCKWTISMWTNLLQG